MKAIRAPAIGPNRAAKKASRQVVNGGRDGTRFRGGGVDEVRLSGRMGRGKVALLLGQVGLDECVGIEVGSTLGHGTITGSTNQGEVHVQNFAVGGERIVISDEFEGTKEWQADDGIGGHVGAQSKRDGTRGAVGHGEWGAVANKRSELATVGVGRLLWIQDSTRELDGFKRMAAVVVAELSDKSGAFGHDVKVEGKPSKVEGTAGVEEASDGHIGRKRNADGRESHVNGDGHDGSRDVDWGTEAANARDKGVDRAGKLLREKGKGGKGVEGAEQGQDKMGKGQDGAQNDCNKREPGAGRGCGAEGSWMIHEHADSASRRVRGWLGGRRVWLGRLGNWGSGVGS